MTSEGPHVFQFTKFASPSVLRQLCPKITSILLHSEGITYAYSDSDKRWNLPYGSWVAIGQNGFIQILPKPPLQEDEVSTDEAQLSSLGSLQSSLPGELRSPEPLLSEGAKDDDGKLKYSLIPARALRELARVYTYGANHYGDHNWRKGLKYSRLLDAAKRHLAAFEMGEADSDHMLNGCSCSHLAHAAFSLFALLEFDLDPKRYSAFDDRWKAE